MEINVIGKQWMWKIQHPEGNREINELHVPVGRDRQADPGVAGCHSQLFSARISRSNRMSCRAATLTEWFQADKIGSYHLFCSEYCGTQHSGMVGRVVVMDPADYQHWLTQAVPATLWPQAGEKLFRELGCSGCHMGNSSRARAAARRALRQAGAACKAAQSSWPMKAIFAIRFCCPSQQIAAGYTNDHAHFQGQHDRRRAARVIAYIKSLRRPDAQSGGQLE